MIAYLKGLVAGSDASCLVLDVGGVGYCLQMSSKAIAALPAAGSPAMVWVHICMRLPRYRISVRKAEVSGFARV